MQYSSNEFLWGIGKHAGIKNMMHIVTASGYYYMLAYQAYQMDWSANWLSLTRNLTGL